MRDLQLWATPCSPRRSTSAGRTTTSGTSRDCRTRPASRFLRFGTQGRDRGENQQQEARSSAPALLLLHYLEHLDILQGEFSGLQEASQDRPRRTAEQIEKVINDPSIHGAPADGRLEQTGIPDLSCPPH